MATIAAPVKSPEAGPQKGAEEMRYIARQPILDENHRVHAYELHFQMNPEAVMEGDEVRAMRTILDDAVLFGIERFTNGLPAFVNCTAEALTEQLVAVLPPAMTVLEISADLEVSPALAAACRELKQTGFRFALVDFCWNSMPHPLFDLVEYVKTDLDRLDADGCQRLRRRLHGTSTAMMADKVETQEDYRRASAAGFTLFEGYYFCHPELIKNSKVPANRLVHLDILRQLHNDPLDLKKIGPLVLRDASLTYRLLRLVNSPLYAIRQEVRSIESAIMLVGETTFRRIATLAICSESNTGEPPEILHMALVRARFCELAAKHCGLDPNEQYLLGMFSLLPAMMRQSMERLASELPLRNEIRQALLGENNRERSLLAWIESHERNDQGTRDAIAETNTLNLKKLVLCYLDALLWDAAARRSAN